jgi:hypothetical protein
MACRNGAASVVSTIQRVAHYMHCARALCLVMRISAAHLGCMCLWPHRSDVKDSSELLHMMTEAQRLPHTTR